MANKFGEGSQADYDKFMIFKKSDSFKGVPAGKTWVWYMNPNPRPKTEIGENGMEKEQDYDEFYTAEVTTETTNEYILDTDKGEIKVPKKNCFMRNPMRFDGVDDMSQLTHLSEATVLYNLKLRYMEDIIHTYSGLFCVVINPYRFFPIYTPFLVNKYQGRRKEDCAPHVYAIADGAYRAMLDPSSKYRNQSILITGESGAGKTENTKRVIQFLAMTAGQSKKASGQLGELEEQLIDLNPMLEAFGNAKTVKNNNSSRFGKFLEIQFSNGGKIVGCIMSSYLLEKSRIVYQAREDRNYHIFYQLLAGANAQQKAEMHLDKPETYRLIYQNKKSPQEIDVEYMDDAEEFATTIKAMRSLNISDDDQNSIFRIIAGMLHLGNVKYEQNKEGAEVSNLDTFARAAEMFGVDAEHLRKAIIQPKIKAGTEIIERHLSKEEAEFNTNATLKAIYHRLFMFIVEKVNEVLGKTGAHSIGILDIAGFEIFRENSFEQLCINLTNEKLQQFFNNHMFNLEQQEYQNEGIPWKQQNFGDDLQPVIDLIEQKIPSGLLSMLDEQSFVASGTDENFHNNICNTFGRGHPRFRKPRVGGAGVYEFDILHYAGTVTYNANDWVRKNRDPLERDIQQVFIGKDSTTLISRLFRITSGIAGSSGDEVSSKSSKAAKFLTVGSNHKTQLEELMRKLKMTNPHFIRCILPNTQKKQRTFVDSTVLKQLRCNGVLEGIRITRMGYPNRMIYSEFLKRYYFLGDKINRRASDEKASSATLMRQIVDKYPKDGQPRAKEGEFQFGKTKIFFKVGILAEIEEVREAKISEMLGGLQAAARAFAARKHFSVLREQANAVTVIQRTLKSWVQFRNWPWWKLYVKARPMLKRINFEEEVKKKDKDIEELKKKLAEEIERRKKAEEALASATAKIGELEAKIVDLEDKISDLENKLETAELDKSELKLKIENLEEDKEELKEEIDKKKSELKDAKLQREENEDEIDELKSTIISLNANLEKKDKTIQDMQDTIDDKESEISKGKEEIKALEEEKDDVDQERRDISQSKDDLARRLKKLDIECEDCKDKIEKLEDELDEMTNKNKDLSAELQQTQLKLGDTEKDLASQVSNTKKVTEERDAVTQKFENEKLTTKNLTKVKAELEKKISGLKQDNEDLEDEKSNVETSLRNAQKKIKELDEEITKGSDVSQYLQQQKNDYEAQLTKMQEEKDAINGNLKKTEKEKREKELEIASLEEKLADAEGERDEAETKRKNLERELKQILDEKDGLEGDKNSTERERKRVENDLKEAQRKLEESEAEVNTLKGRNKELDEQLTEASDAQEKASNEAETLKKKNTQNEKEISNLKSDIEAMQKSKKKEAENEKTLLTEDLEAAQEKLKSVQAELRKTAADLAEANEKKSEIEALKDKLNDANKKMSKQIEEFKTKDEENSYKIENLEKVLKRKEADLEETQENLDVEKKDRMNKEKQSKKLEAEIKELKEKLNASVAERDSVFNAKKQVAAELDDLMETVSEHDEIVSGLKTQITKLTNDNKSFEDEIDELREKNSKDKKKISELEEQILGLEDKPTGPVVDQNEIRIRDVKIDDLNKALEIRGEQNNTLTTANKELKSKNAELSSKIEIVENEIKRLENTKKRLENDKEEAEKDLSEQTIKRKGLEEENKNLNTRIQELTLKINSPVGIAEAEEKARLEGDITALKEQLEQERITAADAESKRKKAEEELAEVKFNLEDVTAQREKLLNKSNELELEAESLKEEKNALNTEVEKITDDVNRLNDELDSTYRKYDLAMEQKDSDAVVLQKFQDELKNVKEMLEEEKKGHAETSRLKGRLEKEAAEYQVKLESESKGSEIVQQEKTKLTKELRARDAELTTTISELEDVKEELMKVEDELDDKNSELDTVTQKYNILAKQKATFDAKMQEMNEQLDIEKAARSKAQKQKSNYEKKLRELQENDNDFEEYRESAEKRMKKLSSQKDDLQKELERERSLKQDSDKEVQRLRSKVQEVESKLNESSASNVSVAKVKARYEAEIDDLTKEAEDALKAKHKSDKKFKSAAKKLDELQRQITDFETKEASFNTSIGRIQADLKKTQQQVRDDETRINELEDEIKKGREAVSNKQLEVEKVQKQYHKLKRTYDRLVKAQNDDSDD
ncbi:Myosin-2 heavy chain [Entamoeba marina]